MNLGKYADALYKANESIAAANATLSELQKEKAALEEKMLAALDEAGTNLARGKLATVSATTKRRYGLSDFEEFAKFCIKRKALHLFERRIAQNAAKEMEEMLGSSIPGTSVFESRSLSITKVRS